MGDLCKERAVCGKRICTSFGHRWEKCIFEHAWKKWKVYSDDISRLRHIVEMQLNLKLGSKRSVAKSAGQGLLWKESTHEVIMIVEKLSKLDN